MGNGTYLLWLDGIEPERLDSLPAVRGLTAYGVDARLTPLPLAAPSTCYYQTLTGMGSGKLGRFDAVRPVAYQARDDCEAPEGAWRRLLPDLLRAAGLTTMYLEVDTEDASSVIEGAVADCIILRLRDAANVGDDALDAVVRQCAEQAQPTGHSIVLTDVWRPSPHMLVNVNDFLVGAGLLETQASGHAGGDIVWPETLAYGLGAGQVWVNMRGREPQGIVEPGREYDEVRAALVAALFHDWHDPATGEPIVAQVLTKEEAYTGEHLFHAPDLVVIYHLGYAPSPRATALGLDGTSARPSGDGTGVPACAPYARLVGAGPAIASGAQATGRLIDVVPSVLYLLGQPIPPHVDGHVLTDLFALAYQQQTPIVTAEDASSALSEEEESAIVGRLQALGYLG